MGDLTMGHKSYGTIIRRGVHNSITVGKYCSIAVDCVVDGGFSHNVKFVSTYPFSINVSGCGHLTGHPVWKGDVNIGNDVWIGESCLIMSGVNIGDGAVIGARSIVTRDVPPYSIVAGSPAKVIRKRFTESQIETLLNIKWWDWEDSRVFENAHLLMSESIDEFIEKNK